MPFIYPFCFSTVLLHIAVHSAQHKCHMFSFPHQFSYILATWGSHAFLYPVCFSIICCCMVCNHNATYINRISVLNQFSLYGRGFHGQGWFTLQGSVAFAFEKRRPMHACALPLLCFPHLQKWAMKRKWDGDCDCGVVWVGCAVQSPPLDICFLVDHQHPTT